MQLDTKTTLSQAQTHVTQKERFQFSAWKPANLTFRSGVISNSLFICLLSLLSLLLLFYFTTGFGVQIYGIFIHWEASSSVSSVLCVWFLFSRRCGCSVSFLVEIFIRINHRYSWSCLFQSNNDFFSRRIARENNVVSFVVVTSINRCPKIAHCSPYFNCLTSSTSGKLYQCIVFQFWKK